MRLLNVLGILSSVVLSACRSSTSPPIDVCIGDGFGGADCVLASGDVAYRSPSELKNFWMTTQDHMRQYSAWCYDTNAANVDPAMAEILKKSAEVRR